MSTPPPIDPYLTLGVAQNADLGTIRSAHRKLVLKHHPDRIKDEAERAKGHEEFQKVQQAYELLSDPAKRSQYDDEVKLAELRKEAMQQEIPIRGPAPSFFARSATFTASRDFQQTPFYEERVPRDTSYFEGIFIPREEPIRASARKGGSYSRRTPAASYTEKTASWKAGGIPIEIAVKLQQRAAGAKERVRDRHARAAAAKSRDQDRRREAADKQKSRSAYVEPSSASDSDTATYASVNRHNTSSSGARGPSRPEMPFKTHSEYQRRDSRYSDDEEDLRRNKHQDLHASAWEYIQRAAPDRPKPSTRHDSSYSYHYPTDEGAHSRRGEDDREEKRGDRERSSKSSRSDARPRKPPGNPTSVSDPVKIVIPDDRRGAPQPHRSNTSQPLRDSRREVPSMPRSTTLPTSTAARRGDNQSGRGSNLKYGENQDSGYGSSSSPVTADLDGTSPSKYTSATRYQIFDKDDNLSGGHRTVLVEPEDLQRPSLSTWSSRSKPSRSSTSYTTRSTAPETGSATRPAPSRRETARPPMPSRESVRVSRSGNHQRERKPLFRETSSDEKEEAYSRRGSSAKNSAHQSQRSSRDSRRDDDYYPGSKYKADLRNPLMGKRPSVY